MSKRIFRSIFFSALLAVVLTAVLIVPALYNAHEATMSRELRQEADSLSRAMALLDDGTAFLSSLNTSSRITLIDPSGAVLFDSMADTAQMGSHASRPEIVKALESGWGESTRTSATLSETTVYCALRMEDGRILRLANTRRSMLGTFVNVLPLVCAMMLAVGLASLLLARRAARKIVAPINALDLEHPLDNDAYDELAPLLTRMHRQHQQLQQEMHTIENARAELAAIMANMREGMLLLDRQQNVLSINDSAAAIFDTPAAGAAGRSLMEINRSAPLHTLVQRSLEGQPASMTMSRGGRQYDIFASPVMKEDTVRGAVLLMLDVTERVAAEESRKEFTANVSHELKTPLTSISGFAEIIRDGIAKPEDVPRFAGMICKESARLMSLVNDILMLSRLDEGKSLGQKENVPLCHLLKDLAEDFMPAAEKKRLTLSAQGDETAAVCGYPLLLREMFFNLIDNAVKYTPEGGQVSIRVESREGQTICTVQDTGIGIPKEHQSHVFERFYRVDKSHSRQTGGTGLGLAIVKHAAQIHNAELRLTSAENAGTTVEILF